MRPNIQADNFALLLVILIHFSSRVHGMGSPKFKVIHKKVEMGDQRLLGFYGKIRKAKTPRKN